MIDAVYIHIPFCNKICSYCDFAKVYYDSKLVDNYLEALEEEIKSTYKGEVINTIYIGGGTPSSLNNKELEKLFKIIKIFKTSSNLEYSMEANFDITRSKLLLLKKYGINRISLGIESINKNNLELLERVEDKKKITNKMKILRSLGFKNINLDLMYAIPRETRKILATDLDFILSLKPEHISTYSLIIEEHTKLHLNKIKNIDSNVDLLMYKDICKKLKSSNYIHYEISNFALQGYQSKHNLKYWHNLGYYGFGIGASSYIDNKRRTNTRSFMKYFKKDYFVEEENITLKDEIYYQIILNLRLKSGINKEEFYHKYNKNLNDLYDYKDLLDHKLLKENKKRIWIPENKWYISNEILVNLLEGDKNG
jgi:putative oxygen-independent coproporphyrinogen III oxidase